MRQQPFCSRPSHDLKQIDPLYIAEISPAAHRGHLVTWSEVALNVGIVFGFLSGIIFYGMDDNLQWRLMLIMGCILPIVMIILVQTVMPESPRFLVDKGQIDEAKMILQKLYPEGKVTWIVLKRFMYSDNYRRCSWLLFLIPKVLMSIPSSGTSRRRWSASALPNNLWAGIQSCSRLLPFVVC